jgi:hypothetical protein
VGGGGWFRHVLGETKRDNENSSISTERLESILVSPDYKPNSQRL